MRTFFAAIFRAIQQECAVVFAASRGERAREVLRWCIPALALGATARVALEIRYPYGYFQADTPDFLITAERLVRHHQLVIHGKKAFLTPILFTLPFLLHIPAMIIIPAVQHISGLLATLFAGGLVRCWFKHWRWFIIPATLMCALNPALLWYEHALMAECQYLFCVTATALIGTLFVIKPTLRRYVWLIIALFFTAGSRPEGKLFAPFGIALAGIVYFGDWKLWARRLIIMTLCCAVIWSSSRSTQAGILLYATVLPIAPEASKAAPGVEPYVLPLRQMSPTGNDTVRIKLTAVERAVYSAIGRYLDATKPNHKDRDSAHINALAQKIALEAMLHKPELLPAIAANKFLMTCRYYGNYLWANTSGGFSAFWVHGMQLDALLRRKAMLPLMPGLYGRDLTPPDFEPFLNKWFVPLTPDWFTPLQNAWSTLTLGAQTPSHKEGDQVPIPGWPALWLIAAAGMLAGACDRRDGLWRFHLPWVAILAAVWFAVMLTGVVNSRYRFVFEPFGVLYALLFLDFFMTWASIPFRSRHSEEMQPLTA